MAKTFSAMKTNVGNQVQDTSTGFATIIGRYLNDKYRDIASRMMWSALIDDDYTVTTVADQAAYTLETDFDEELFVANITSGQKLARMSEGTWWRERHGAYSSGSIPSGTPARYKVQHEASKLYLDPAPDTANETIAVPYNKKITELSGDSDAVVIRDIEIMMEYGAIGEAWAYKRQFQKANFYLNRYEIEVRRRVGQERSKINNKYQFVPDMLWNGTPRPMTGWNSYDSV